MRYDERQGGRIPPRGEDEMSRLFEFGRLGKMYVEWEAAYGKRPLDVWTSRGELLFMWKKLHVIVTPPSALRDRDGAAWGIV
jgi:hypothetical protein